LAEASSQSPLAAACCPRMKARPAAHELARTAATSTATRASCRRMPAVMRFQDLCLPARPTLRTTGWSAGRGHRCTPSGPTLHRSSSA
jgi:hypothetical protein